MKSDFEKKIIIAGSGGQGILFLGKLLASAGMQEGHRVTWFPSYGAEMRGGTANCTVILADRMIGSPVVQHPDILVVMNKASLERFLPSLVKGGLLLYDDSLVHGRIQRKDIRAVAVPATSLASAAGSTKSANMVMLGALVSCTRAIRDNSVMAVFEPPVDAARKKAYDMNIAAYREGLRACQNP